MTSLDSMPSPLSSACSCLGNRLEDELYCQLCKHLTCNQIAWSETKAWELLLICLFAVPVSAVFQSHLLNFVVRRRAQFQSIHDRNDEERSIAVLVNNVYNAIVAANFDVALIKQVRGGTNCTTSRLVSAVPTSALRMLIALH